MKAKVQDHPDLIRDMRSKAILNVNQNALQEHISKQKMKENIHKVQEEVNLIKNDLSEIKKLLSQLVSKGQ